MNDNKWNFTKKFVKNNIEKNEENKVLCQDHTFIDPIQDITEEFELSELDDIFNCDDLQIHYTLENDNKYIDICVENGIDFIYYFEIHFAKDFDVKRMLDLFLNRTERKNVQIDLVEDQNRNILKIC